MSPATIRMPSAPTDYVLFALASVATLAGVARWLTRRGQVPVRELRPPLLLLALILAGGFFFVAAAGDTERRRVLADVAAFAPTYAQEMELLGHAALGPETNPDDPAYLHMIEAEKRWLRANPLIADIYTLKRLGDGSIVFLVDSETDYDGDGTYGQEREGRTAIGEAMVTSAPRFIDDALQGKTVVDDNVETDRWGSWIAAYAPIRGPDGQPEAVLGVDYRSDQYLARIRHARLDAIGALAVLLSILLALTTLIVLLRSNLAAREASERELNEAAVRVRELNQELEAKVHERTEQLQSSNRELEMFAYSVSHDLRTPLRSIEGFANLMLADYGAILPEEGHTHLQRIQRAGRHMADLIDDLLLLSRVTRSGLRRQRIDLTALARTIAEDLRSHHADRNVTCTIADGLSVEADNRLLAVLLDNLLANAWKYTARREQAHVEVGRDSRGVFFVRDDGCGFDMRFADQLFQAFRRLHDEREFEGNGIGLATVARIVERHGGKVWAQAEVDRGATFFFTLSPG